MDLNLNGLYRVSFDIQMTNSDALTISDLAHTLTEGILSEELAAKVSHLKMEKIEKHGKTEPKILKIGDKVYLKESLTLKASVYEDDGYLFIGKPTSISNEIGEQNITLEAGSVGYVNRIDGANIELVDVDRAVKAELGFDPEYEQLANVDLITVNAEQIDIVEVQ